METCKCVARGNPEPSSHVFFGGKILLNPSGNVPSWHILKLETCAYMHNHTHTILQTTSKHSFFPHHSVVVNVCVVNIGTPWVHLVTCFIRLPLMPGTANVEGTGINDVFICCGLEILRCIYLMNPSTVKNCPWNTVLSSVSLCFIFSKYKLSWRRLGWFLKYMLAFRSMQEISETPIHAQKIEISSHP